MRGYDRTWLRGDLMAGATLAAVAIPETMGYTSIAQTPIVTGLYTVIFPTVVFAVIGSSRLLVVGADSATAALLATGLAGLGISGVTPYSPQWLAMASLTALVCAVLLVIARVLRLGFVGDFLSASVLIGFLTGVGIQVLTGQIPDMLGVPKASGNWFEQQWGMIKEIPDTNLWTLAFALGTIAIIVGCKRFAPRAPGAIIAVVLSIILASALDVAQHGVALVGQVTGGFPPVGLPSGVSLGDALKVLGIAFSCAVLIIAQSAATSRSFAAKHRQRVDVNQDILALGGANLAAGLTGTFVVNGSPTKTQILDEQKGRSQLANLAMSAIVLVVVLFATGLLTDMAKAVLAGIVFLIGLELVDIAGLRRIRAERLSEFVVAVLTAVTVFAVGVEQGIILAVILSLLDIVRRLYKPADFVVGVDSRGGPTYTPARPGMQSLPGLVVFRFDADLFYANAGRFVDGVQALVEHAPNDVRWLVLDCGGITDIDYSAGLGVVGLIDYLDGRGTTFAVAGADDGLRATMAEYGIMDRVGPVQRYSTVEDAVSAFRADSAEGSA